MQVMLLGLKYGDFIWDCAFPCRVEDPECFPCIFLQFASTPSIPRDGNDTCLVQVFSKQVSLVHLLLLSIGINHLQLTVHLSTIKAVSQIMIIFQH